MESGWTKPRLQKIWGTISPLQSYSVNFGCGGIMLWRGINWKGRNQFVEVFGRITSDLYVENILKEYVEPYIGYIGYERCVLMHHNCRSHAAGTVTNVPSEVQIKTLDWLPHSQVTSTKQEFRIAAHEEGNEIPQKLIQTLLFSMPRRMQAVISATGGNSYYLLSPNCNHKLSISLPNGMKVLGTINLLVLLLVS